ncbi:hypothetical protein SALBM217S_04982 [Streptomyces griseoloalbus]
MLVEPSSRSPKRLRPRRPSTVSTACRDSVRSTVRASPDTTLRVTPSPGTRSWIRCSVSASTPWIIGSRSAGRANACTIRSRAPRSRASSAATSAAARLEGEPSTPTITVSSTTHSRPRKVPPSTHAAGPLRARYPPFVRRTSLTCGDTESPEILAAIAAAVHP